MKIPLSEARVGVVSTAALYRKGKDEPFADTVEGDPRVIEIPSDVVPGELDTAHTHIPPEAIRADVNVALPLNPLRALAAEKRIQQFAPRVFSILGYRTRADEVALDTAPAIAAAMAEDKVSLALIVPVWPVCHQTGGLVAREIEAWGIPTITMANVKARIELVRPPRWVFVRFPRGAMFGEPGNAVKQRQALEAVLEAAAKIVEPGGNIELPFRWEAKPISWRGREITEGP